MIARTRRVIDYTRVGTSGSYTPLNQVLSPWRPHNRIQCVSWRIGSRPQPLLYFASAVRLERLSIQSSGGSYSTPSKKVALLNSSRKILEQAPHFYCNRPPIHSKANQKLFAEVSGFSILPSFVVNSWIRSKQSAVTIRFYEAEQVCVGPC